MPVLNDTVQQINESLVSSLLSKSKRFQGAKLYGICEQAIKNGSQKETYPSVFDLSGDGKYVGIDDQQSLIIYHRKQTVSVSEDTTHKGYGDNAAGSINVYNLSMIVFFSRKKIGLESDELALFLQRHIPPEPTNKNFHYLSVTINSVILNSQQVFRTEYSNVDYFLKPEHALIAINYSLEGKPNLACFNSCPE
jgi:hypothetical protein